jgi:hypothetical protein
MKTLNEDFPAFSKQGNPPKGREGSCQLSTNSDTQHSHLEGEREGWDVARWYSACLACVRPWV